MTKRNKLVWLDINSSYSHSSLALPAIEACRGEDNYTWESVSGTINSDVYLIVKQVFEKEPTVIAGTMWLFNHQIMLMICERLKALLPEVEIVLGGPEFNGSNEQFLRANRFVSKVFRGEGEIEFNKFLLGVPLSEIKGLCYLNTEGEYVDNGECRVADFASLPAPEKSEFFCFSSPFVQLEFSRGCFNSCAFCVSGGDKPIRVKPVEQIRQRIEFIREKGIKDVRVLDRTFNFSPSRAEAMLNLFTDYPDMNFHLEIHPALLNERLFTLLESMPEGLLHLEAGMQSLDDKVIKACGRVGTNEDALAGLRRLCAMSNFETHADLIAGLPLYTLEQIFRDVRTLSELKAGEIQLELLKLLPGTKMRNEAEDLGIRYAHTPPYEVLQTPSISLFELDRARLLSKLLDKYYNAKGWQEITRTLINENADFLTQFLDFLIETDLLEKPLSLEKRGVLLYDFCERKMDGRYLDQVSLQWIENGLSLKHKQAGKIEKAKELPDTLTREANVHYYLWQGKHACYIIGFDRSQNHSHPTLRVQIKFKGLSTDK